MDYRQWTLYYMHLTWDEEEGKYQFCATLNAMPIKCEFKDKGSVFLPGEFLSAIEFTTSVLVSPIEVGTEAMSASEVQRKYYQRCGCPLDAGLFMLVALVNLCTRNVVEEILMRFAVLLLERS